MAIARQVTGDISVFSVNSGALIASARNVNVQCPADLVEGRGIAYKGENPQAVGQEVIIETTQMSNIDSCTRVANVDVSAFTLNQNGGGATDFLTYLQGGNLNFSWPLEDIGGVANYWKYNMPMFPLGVTGQVRLLLPNSDSVNAVRTFLGGIMHATIATAILNRNVALSVTINGVAFAVPMIIQNASWAGEDSRPQIVTLDLKGKDCNATFPTTPSGTTTLLEKSLNAATTPLAFSFTPKSANSTNFAGELVPASFGFAFEKRQIIATDYKWHSHGVVTPTNT